MTECAAIAYLLSNEEERAASVATVSAPPMLSTGVGCAASVATVSARLVSANSMESVGSLTAAPTSKRKYSDEDLVSMLSVIEGQCEYHESKWSKLSCETGVSERTLQRRIRKAKALPEVRKSLSL